MDTPGYLVGNVVSVTFDGKLMYAKSGSVTRKVKMVDVTNARSNKYTEKKKGNKELAGDCTCVYNGDDPPTLNEGDEGTVVYAAVGGGNRTANVYITEVKDNFTNDADYVYSFSFESSGAYTSTG